jgi:hypothetical protein
MWNGRPRSASVVLAAVLACAVAPSFGATPPDASIFATYSIGIGANAQYVDWIVCGGLPNASGCFANGELGPFGTVGALLEGPPVTKGNVVTRRIYVLDTASGTAANSVTLNVYKRVDVITSSSDAITVSAVAQRKLVLAGGANARPSMAANRGYLYIGTNLDPRVVQVKQSNNSVVVNAGYAPGANVSAINANSLGYTAITFGSNSGFSGFIVFNPDGTQGEGGGGASFTLGTVSAFVPSGVPLFP